MTHVAILGTGIMGAPMARNAARAGLDVFAWSRPLSDEQRLSADGITVCQTAGEAARDVGWITGGHPRRGRRADHAVTVGLRRAERRTSHEYVVEALRGAIVSGQLAAGTRLVQSELAQRLGMSTTPIREAIRDLVSEGLLEFDRYRGAVVHEPTPHELQEIYAIRVALEPLAMRSTAEHISANELQEAAALVEAMERTDDVAVFVGLNRRFHEVLTEAAHQPRLAGMLRTLRDTSALYVGASLAREPKLMRSTNREHAELLEALAAQDPERAAERIVTHLRNTVQSLEPEAR